ncbi:Pyridoxal kinase like protein [Verticillium longisporum]|nr:Pyridoxal kinase like protein [Verticillium longisporum]
MTLKPPSPDPLTFHSASLDCMASELPVPETRVLAVASHVVSGNVGNKIAVFTLQSLGCEVAALNTVQFSPFSQSFWQLSPA